MGSKGLTRHLNSQGIVLCVCARVSACIIVALRHKVLGGSYQLSRVLHDTQYLMLKHALL